jgi:hypothetical protein
MAPALEDILGEVEADIKAGKNLSPAFSTAESAISYLDNL